MLATLVIGYLLASIAITTLVAALMGRTRMRVASSLAVHELEQQSDTEEKDYGQKAA